MWDELANRRWVQMAGHCAGRSEGGEARQNYRQSRWHHLFLKRLTFSNKEEEMSTHGKLAILVIVLMIAPMVLAACGATPEPVIQTVEVEKEVKVVETVEVEKEVKVVETVEVAGRAHRHPHHDGNPH
jgi:hypothetical protein